MKRIVVGAVVALLSLSSSPALAQSTETGTVTVLHGVPGLTVDVYANGKVLIPGFAPGSQSPPTALPAGEYAIAIRPAGAAPDSAPAISSTVTVPAGVNASAIAHLDAAGTPKLSVFVNDVKPLGLDEARVTVRHTAAFGPVDVLAGGQPLFQGVTNGQEGTTTVPAGTYPIAVTAAGDPATSAFSGDVAFEGGNAYLVHAIGDPAAGTFTLLTQTVDGLGAEVLGVQAGSGGLLADENSGRGGLLLLGLALATIAVALATPTVAHALRRR
jgi:hypothetical protein